MEILSGIIWFAIGAYLINRMLVKRDLGLKRQFVLIVFLIKCLLGVSLLYIYNGRYEERHKADVYKFYDDAGYLMDLASDEPSVFFQLFLGYGDDDVLAGHTDKMENWNRQYDHGFTNDNKFMIRLNTGFRFLGFNSIWAAMVIANILVMIALIWLCQTFVGEAKQHAWFIGFAWLIPSLLFWNSGMLKEPIMLFGLAAFMKGTSLLRNRLFFGGILLIVGLLILVNVKTYVLLALMMAMIVFGVLSMVNKKHLIMVLTICLGLVLAYTASLTDFGKQQLHNLAYKQRDFINIAAGGVIVKNDHRYIMLPYKDRASSTIINDSVLIQNGSSYPYFVLPNTVDTLYEHNHIDTCSYQLIIDNPPSGSEVFVPNLENNFGSFAKAIPFALINTIIRPLPFEHASWLVTIAGFENLVLLFVIALTIIKSKRRDEIAWSRLYPALVFVIIIFLLIGLATPVLGAIVRYKAPILLFLMYVCFLIVDFNKLEEISWIEKIRRFVSPVQVQE